MSIKNAKIALIKNAVERVAKDLNIHPSMVSKKDLQGEVSDWTFKLVGGLDLVKRKYFPIQEKELAAIENMKKDTSYVNKLEKQLAEKLSLEEEIRSVLKNIKPVSVTPFKSKSKVKIKRELNLVLSDLHIGSDIKAEETGTLDFGRKEEARRLAFIIKEVMDYKAQYRKETKLNLILLGDIIQNQLHDPRDGAPLIEQSIRAINLLNQALAQLSSSFPEIVVYCNTGNHGRLSSRHPKRAVLQKWDSIETLIYYALKESSKNLKNVSFVIPKTPYVSYEVFGKKIFCTHGDNVLNPGYPGKGIRTGILENQINRINASLKDADEYSVFIVGHVHVSSVTHLSNGAVMITNGAMVPVDEFAVSIGLTESAAGQILFESTEGFPVGDLRYIKVNEEQDKDTSLEKIIKPFEKF